MNRKIAVASVAIFLCLSGGAFAAGKGPKPSLAPTVIAPEDADKVIMIKDKTKGVNVFENESVLFKIGDKQFAVRFDGTSHLFDLRQFAPAGTLDHKVTVYVAPDPSEYKTTTPF